MNTEKVLVAMSGGVDSSITAFLLKEQGWEVIGVTFRMWDYLLNNCKAKETGCCSIESINDAKTFADKLRFQHYIIDCRKEFLTSVVENFQSEYLAGATPNPCVRCNKYIKWHFLTKFADEIGCKYIATGHYAKVNKCNGRYFISKGADKNKDQSYFLWSLEQKDLARTIFPLGNLTKEEVKTIAEEKEFKKIKSKRESMEICFIPSGNYRQFIRERLKNTTITINEGNFVDMSGKIIGKHKGYPFYTIGQRKGTGIAVGKPLYVIKINHLKNEIILGNKEDLIAYNLKAKNINMMKYTTVEKSKILSVKIRYQDKGTKAMVINNEQNMYVEFIEPVTAVTPGQSAVVYEENDIVAGGIITS